MKHAFLFAFLALPAVSAHADPRGELAGDWWGTIAERRLSLAADGTLTEFRPADAAERKGTWEVAGDRLTMRVEGRPEAETLAFAIEGDFLTLMDAEGRTARLRKEARADREKRLTDLLVEGKRKRRESEEEPDQFRRERLIAESTAATKQAEPILRSLIGADRGKQSAYADALVGARAPELLETSRAVAGGAEVIQPRASEPPGSKKSCSNHLKQIGVYFALYESKFKEYPKSIAQLMRPDMCTDEKLMHCPADAEGQVNRYGYARPAKGDATPADAVMAWDLVPHQDGTRNVLLFQGRVLSMNEEDFRRALAAAGGKLTLAPPRARDVKARSRVQEGKLVVTVRAKIVDLKPETADGKERVKGRIRTVAIVEGKAVESGVQVVSGDVSADGYAVEVTVTLAISDPDRIDSVTLLVEDRIAGETGETRIEGKKVRRDK